MLTTIADWKELLDRWTPVVAGPDRVLGIGAAPATADAIASLERRVKAPLPPSYRAFLMTTDGWRHVSRAVRVLRPVAEVEWFRTKNREWIDAMSVRVPLPPPEIYFSYSDAAAGQFHPEHLRQTLQISDIGDAAVFLLNPQVVHADGEWEAWLLASWLPGVNRYRSFGNLMLAQYSQLMGEPSPRSTATSIAFENLPTVYRDPAGRTPRRTEKHKPPRPTDELLRIAQSHSWNTTMQARIRAIEELSAYGPAAAIPVLRKLIHDPLEDVATAALEALARLRDEASVPEFARVLPLGGTVSACAISALGEIASSAAREVLRSHLRSNPADASMVLAALARCHDPQGAQAAIDLLVHPTTPESGRMAGQLAAGFGELAVDGLCSAATHENREVRASAVAGLGLLAYSSAARPEGRLAAGVLKERIAVEQDAGIRQEIGTHLAIMPRQV